MLLKILTLCFIVTSYSSAPKEQAQEINFMADYVDV